MLTQVVEDVRERLVFATHVFIKKDILGFRPSPGDLAYPEKLQMMEVRQAVAQLPFFFPFFMLPELFRGNTNRSC
jgi:hypothetical protein